VTPMSAGVACAKWRYAEITHFCRRSWISKKKKGKYRLIPGLRDDDVVEWLVALAETREPDFNNHCFRSRSETRRTRIGGEEILSLVTLCGSEMRGWETPSLELRVWIGAEPGHGVEGQSVTF
jgi:hypothetical protein